MPGNDEFCTYPDTFLTNELVITPPYDDKAGIYYFSVSKAYNMNLADLETIDKKSVWQLDLHKGKKEKSIPAYWCPYVANGTGNITLGSQATFMFTAGFTGCSFGFGMPGSDGALRVAHANTQEESAEEQAEAQAKQLRSKGVTPRFEPGAYRTKGVGQATVFGIRGLIHWRIFAHRFKSTETGLHVEDLGVERLC